MILLALCFCLSGIVDGITFPKFERVISFSTNDLKEIEKETGGDGIVSENVCVDSVDGVFCVGLLIWNPSYGVKLIFVDGNRKIHRESQWINSLSEIGEHIEFRALDGLIYLSAAESSGYVVTGDSLKLCENPWFEKNVHLRFPSIPVAYGEGLDGRRVPLFRLWQNTIEVIRGNDFCIYDSSGRLKSRTILRTETGKDLFKPFFYRTDPIVGIFGKKVFLTICWEIYQFDKEDGAIISFPLEYFFNPGEYGERWTEGDECSSSSYVGHNTLFLSQRTDRGFYLLRYVP